MAPEYCTYCELNEKCDVYSYGVVLLELISGRRPYTADSSLSMLEYIRQQIRAALQNNDFTELVDPRLTNQYNPDEIMRMIACGVACTRSSPHERPSMSQIALVLGGKLSPEILGSIDSDNYSQDNYSQNQNNIYEATRPQDLSEVFNTEGR